MSDVELLLRTEAARLRAPEELRARVLETAAGARAPRFTLPPLRRGVLLVAPLAVAAVAAAAVVHGFLSSGSRQTEQGQSAAAARAYTLAFPHGAAVPQPKSHIERAPSTTLDSAAVAGAAPAQTGRLTDYQATLRVRVRDLDRLTQTTSEAVRIVRSLGGYAASVNTTTGNGPGESYLELRVPASRVQDALLRLSGLGTVLSQQLSLQDLQNVVASQNAKIAALRRAIHRIEIALAAPALPADVRVRLKIQRDEAQRALGQRTHAKNATLREAATARVSLELTTQRNAVEPAATGRFGRAVGGAVSFLAGAGAVALAILIGASPFLLLAALFVAARRAWRRREEQRLLAAQ